MLIFHFFHLQYLFNKNLNLNLSNNVSGSKQIQNSLAFNPHDFSCEHNLYACFITQFLPFG